ncbi:protein mono-ADP-ribosyltransferase PARP12-like [Megalops cyprinoides]|uniref:protein mono-ADP-ribosyltransferase PARP12-like n=1 Tax=Megalops cyprinoides TaxID=118141 RepID=UPI001864F8EB|nr:protein mono-ADP-ribosyltransferase PARP12-like [Megalops cyprinoides]
MDVSPLLLDSITKILCKNQGCLQYGHLCRIIRQTFTIDDELLLRVLGDSTRFAIIEGKEEVAVRALSQNSTVVAKTSLRVCQSFPENCDGCEALHLCRYFVCGNCRYRDKCKYCHDLDSTYNIAALKRTGLQNMEEKELFQLLLRNDSYLLPEICTHYNKGDGEHGACVFRADCNSLHICKHFVQDDCMFGSACRRAHMFNHQAKRILKGRGLSQDNMQVLRKIYKNKFMITGCTDRPDDPSVEKEPHHRRSKEASRNEICMFFIRNNCHFKEKCFCVHFHLPYKWQALDSDGTTWRDLPNNEDIEEAFCDPKNNMSEGPCPVNFRTMTCGSAEVRRLSTVSSVTKPSNFILTTEWLWYRRGDLGMWSEYNVKADGKAVTSITSQTLENAYQDDPKREIKFSTDGQKYVLSFKGMYELNAKHNMKRPLRRRPRFLSALEVKKALESETAETSTASTVCGSPCHRR